MKKENSITIEGVTINLNTKPEELMATGKFREYESECFEENHTNLLTAEDWIEAFGTKCAGQLYFGNSYIDIKLYPKLDIQSPGYPDPDFEKASWEVCKTIIENNFDNIEYKEDKVSATFSQGKVATFLIPEGKQNEWTGGYISIVIRGKENVY